MPHRVCVDCKRPTPTGNRCAPCQHAHQRRRNAQRAHLQNEEYRKLRREYMDAHLERRGHWCPGHDQHEGHLSYDLTIDHIQPVASGIDPMDTRNWRILCRSANSSKGTR